MFAPSFILPAKAKCKKCKNLFVVGVGSQVVTIEWNGKSTRAKVVRQLFTMDANIPSSRTGMARASPKGRFFGGTYYYPMDCTKPTVLSYYRYDTSKGLVRLFGDLGSTGGIAFNVEARKMYHLTYCRLLLTEYDWDPDTGDICK